LVAGELLADGGALGLGGFAGGVAVGRLADGLALGASLFLALVLGATNGANGLLAVHSALGAGGFLALHLALGALADGVAHSRAGRIITLPLAGGVALGSRGRSHAQKESNTEKEARHFLWFGFRGD